MPARLRVRTRPKTALNPRLYKRPLIKEPLSKKVMAIHGYSKTLPHRTLIINGLVWTHARLARSLVRPLLQDPQEQLAILVLQLLLPHQLVHLLG